MSNKIQETLEQYVQHKNGTMFQVMQHKTVRGKCFLRRGNKYVQKDFLEVRQGIADGTYIQPNEHQIKVFIKDDQEKIFLLTQKMVNRTIHAQALLEIDDSLKEEYEDDKRMVSVLTRSNKEIERLADKMYDRLYAKDNVMSQNLLSVAASIGKKIGGIDIIDMPYLENHIDRFIENIEEHRKEKVYFKSLV